jgi:hypothetical protein
MKKEFGYMNRTQVKISAPVEIAASFKAECSVAGVSMASEIIRFMSGNDAKAPLKKPSADSVSTRQKRRRVIHRVIRLIETVLEAEMQYLENIPENLQSGPMYEMAEQTISNLEEAIEFLNGAFE